MDSTEDIETRLEMRDMHEFFLDKIRGAINQSNYFEAAWLEYACLENRYYRVLGKYKKNCKYCTGKCKSNKNELALRTKERTCLKNKDEVFKDSWMLTLSAFRCRFRKS